MKSIAILSQIALVMNGCVRAPVCRSIVIRHIMKKRIIESVGNDVTDSLIDGDPLDLVSSSCSIMGSGSIDKSPNR